ncbi:hypothetical protein BKA65DRAFT_484451 [Rhexocercosporidium sp. MPI-PUGE-AT-0058]|nr:hypothetical protein BKA65DRAFT_484451 [Rhexocercosporidium sp. MPI-PUGE-AT-0058]
MAGTAISIVVLGLTGIASLPALTDMFAAPVPEKIIVNICVGATNSIAPDGSLGGNAPSASVYDVNEKFLGFGSGADTTIVDGGSLQLSIGGEEGGLTSVTPEYIQLYATGSDAVCVAWFTTTSSSSTGYDFRTWNEATTQHCDMAWYPSTAQFPGLTTSYKPPCFWMSNDGRFAKGFSARLSDFFFPGSSGPANEIASQWSMFKDTLCHAPARQ